MELQWVLKQRKGRIWRKEFEMIDNCGLQKQEAYENREERFNAIQYIRMRITFLILSDEVDHWVDLFSFQNIRSYGHVTLKQSKKLDVFLLKVFLRRFFETDG